MAKYVHSDVLDGGLNSIKNNASRMLLLKAYSFADSYATVNANAICAIAMGPGDYALSGADGAARILTVAARSGTASANSGAAPDLHIAFTDNPIPRRRNIRNIRHGSRYPTAAVHPSGNGVEDQVGNPHGAYADDKSRRIHGCDILLRQRPIDGTQVKKHRLR